MQKYKIEKLNKLAFFLTLLCTDHKKKKDLSLFDFVRIGYMHT